MLASTNILAFCATALITAIKSFVKEAPGDPVQRQNLVNGHEN
jgi:hypothetical protein